MTDIERMAREAELRYRNALIYGTSHPEAYTRPHVFHRMWLWLKQWWRSIRAKFPMPKEPG